MLHPIGFSIPHEKLVTTFPTKTKLLSSIIPNERRKYIYEDENEYYNEYKQSFFALTTKKNGWDCMRHYEILANGCIPYFPDISECPKNTMTLFPKDIIIEGNQLFAKFQTKIIGGLTVDDMNEYINLSQRLYSHTVNYLTTRAMARYVLEKSNHPNAKKILFISGDPRPDYLRCNVLHGFKELLGPNCHDFPVISHIYKLDQSVDYRFIFGYKNFKELYGRGMSYTGLLDASYHNQELDSTVKENIVTKYYDIIIYGNLHREMIFYDIISELYKPNEIILLCGEDIHRCEYSKWVDKGHTVFLREFE